MSVEIIVTNTELLVIHGLYYSTQEPYYNEIIMPYPTKCGTATESDVQEVCQNTFTEARNRWQYCSVIDDWEYESSSDQTDDDLPPADTEAVFTMLRAVLKEELVRIMEGDSSDEHTEMFVKSVLDYALPDHDAYDEYPDKIYQESVVIHFTRVVIQTAFDRLRANGTTHMSVDNPLAITKHKWSKPPIKQDMSGYTTKYEHNHGLELSGGLFPEPVIIPTPDTQYMSQTNANTIVEDVLTQIVNEYNITPKSLINPVETTEFADTLRETLIDTCNKTPVNKPNQVKTEITNILPKQRTYTQVPNTIREKTVAIHITRTVLQTLFDQLRENQSHMTVKNPFNTTEHKWDSTKP